MKPQKAAVTTLTTMAPRPDEDWACGRLVLPGGVCTAHGEVLRTVQVRELNGRDEEIIADQRRTSASGKVTALLTRVLAAIEGHEGEIDEALVDGLLIGDRDFLLLRLRQLNLGDRVNQILRCPSISCGAKVDVEFDISELALRRAGRLTERHVLELSRPAVAGDATSARIELRLPTGVDQAAIGEIAATNSGLANTLLFQRIIIAVGQCTRIEPEFVRDLPLAIRREIVAFLREVSPGPELVVDIQCPECGADMSYDFDLHSFFLASGAPA